MEDKIILIGASTGGPNTVYELLKSLPENIPPIVVCIHMPETFTKQLAERITKGCKFIAKEAQSNDLLKKGTLYLCPGGKQTRVLRTGRGYELLVEDIGRVGGYLPSIDHTFNSFGAVVNPKNIVGVLLTGMGHDGADSLKKLRDRGAFIITQDEASSIVYGMPRVAYELGASNIVLDYRDIGIYIANKFI
ncbi:MAG: CheB methylesterase domain-containing protein [Lachnospirales bacterium]